jgi:hypothetical protein
MPGYAQTLSNVGRAGARARGAAERGAISSNAYGAQIGDIYQKELDALQNLGIQQAQYKSAQLGNVAQAEGAMAGQKEQQWNINQYVPYQTELNRWGEQKRQSTENLFGAMQSGISGLTDLLGTSYYTKMLQGLQGTGSGATLGNQSKPLGGVNAQNNLLGTIGGILKNIPIQNESPYEKILREQKLAGYTPER